LYLFGFVAVSVWLVVGVLMSGGLSPEQEFAGPVAALPLWLAFIGWILNGGYARSSVLPATPGLDPIRIAMALAAAVIATVAWLLVLKVPIVAPVPPIFGTVKVQTEGWAPVWVVGAVAALLIYALLGFVGRFWQPGRLRSAFKRVTSVVIFAFFTARIVRNVAFVWVVPDRTVFEIAAILPQMSVYALGHGIGDLTKTCGPLLLPVALVAATSVALIEGWHPRDAVDRAAQWFDANVLRRLKP
jgi:hypothetical protein